MGNFQYKTGSGGSWADVPKSAYHGTFAGSYEVMYPEPIDRDGYGLPCGAVGLPSISLRSEVMTASGMQFWQARFSASTSLSAEIWLTGFDSRLNTWRKFTGWLSRPKWERLQIGTGSLSTLYHGVEINVDLLSLTAS